MIVLNAQIFGNAASPGNPARQRTILFQENFAALADGTQLDTLDGGTRWVSGSDWIFTAQARILSQVNAATLATSGGLMCRGLGAVGAPLMSGKIIDPTLAWWGDAGVEIDCVLPAGLPPDDYQFSAWVFMLAPHGATGGPPIGNGGMIAAIQTNKVQLYTSQGSGIGVSAAPTIAAGVSHTLRLENSGSNFNLSVDGVQLLTAAADAPTMLALAQNAVGGSIGFGMYYTQFPAAAGVGISAIRVTSL